MSTITLLEKLIGLLLVIGFVPETLRRRAFSCTNPAKNGISCAIPGGFVRKTRPQRRFPCTNPNAATGSQKSSVYLPTSTQMPMQRLTYTGINYDEVKHLCGDKVLAPYFCMGFSMLSVDTGEGFVSVNEGDTIVREDDGSLRVEK